MLLPELPPEPLPELPPEPLPELPPPLLPLLLLVEPLLLPPPLPPPLLDAAPLDDDPGFPPPLVLPPHAPSATMHDDASAARAQELVPFTRILLAAVGNAAGKAERLACGYRGYP